MRKTLRAIALAAGSLAVALPLGGSLPASSAPATASASTAAAPAWSTAAKSGGPTYAWAGQVVTNARGTGRGYDATLDRFYDRVVVDTVSATRSRKVGFSARYVHQVSADGSGQVLSLSGAHKIELVVRAPAYNDAGQTTYYARFNRDLPGVSDGARVVDTVYGGAFEGWTTIGIGLDAKRSFRVLQLTDGRIVLDILR